MYGRGSGARLPPMLTTKTLLTTAAAACLALSLASPASAKPVTYKGKTNAGTTVSLKLSGTTVSALQTRVPVACVSSRTSDTKAGPDAFSPPGALRLGAEQAVAARQPSAFAASGITKNYRVTLKKGKGRRGAVTGRLHMNFMVVEPYFNAMGYLDGNTFICQGDATFTARPR
jgi:hypothetical protein